MELSQLLRINRILLSKMKPQQPMEMRLKLQTPLANHPQALQAHRPQVQGPQVLEPHCLPALDPLHPQVLERHHPPRVLEAHQPLEVEADQAQAQVTQLLLRLPQYLILWTTK